MTTLDEKLREIAILYVGHDDMCGKRGRVICSACWRMIELVREAARAGAEVEHERLWRVIGFLVSVVRSGEGWSDACADMVRSIMSVTDVSGGGEK
jgi:hypothetical protein